MAHVIERHRIAAAAICAILPPPRAFPDNPELPAIGSPEERLNVADAMNDALAAAGAAAGIGFLDPRPAYVDSDGYLDPAKSDGNVHVNFRLTGPIEAALARQFGPAPAA